MSDKIKEFVEIPQQFIREGNQFITRCTKPSAKEFLQICKAVAIGFAVMGFIGYFVKLIHIPINNILRRAIGLPASLEMSSDVSAKIHRRGYPYMTPDAIKNAQPRMPKYQTTPTFTSESPHETSSQMLSSDCQLLRTSPTLIVSSPD